MEPVQACRRLVKSPPELWAELSDAETLARRLAEFGDIRITRVDPETTVAWEGEQVRGTVEIETSGWGTRVKLTATPAGVSPEPAPQVEPPAEPEPERAPEPRPRDEPEPEPTRELPVVELPRRGFLSRLLRWPEPIEPVAEAPPESPLRPVEPVPDPPPPPDPAPSEPEVPETPVEPSPEPEPSDEPPAAAQAERPEPRLDAQRTLELLEAVLDDLGAAHHRPFSRA